MSQKTSIILIVGSSGSGKTHMSQFIEAYFGIPSLVSYTTRPKRDGEVDGIDHYFVDSEFTKSIDPSRMLAYTVFGGYEYFTTVGQTEEHTACSYVVDEAGVEYFMARHADTYNIIPVYVEASEQTRASRGTTQARMDRDRERVQLPLSWYYTAINNDGSTDDFIMEICDFIKSANDKYSIL